MTRTHRLIPQIRQQSHSPLKLVHVLLEHVEDGPVLLLLQFAVAGLESPRSLLDILDLQSVELDVFPLHPLVVPLLLDRPELVEVFVLGFDGFQLVVVVGDNIEDFKSRDHVFFALAEFVALEAELANLIHSPSVLIEISMILILVFESTGAFSVEVLEIFTDISLQISDRAFHLLLLLLEVLRDDLVSFCHSDQEHLPLILKSIDFLVIFLTQAFNFTAVSFAFPALDILEFLLDWGNPAFPGLLLRSDFGVSLLVALEHVQSATVLFEFFCGFFEEID